MKTKLIYFILIILNLIVWSVYITINTNYQELVADSGYIIDKLQMESYESSTSDSTSFVSENISESSNSATELSGENNLGTDKEYHQIIEDNKQMITTKSFDGLEYYSPEALQADELYYALYDFDKNGTNEFILASAKGNSSTGTTTFDNLSSWNRTIFGVFTLKDKEIVTLFNGMGYRTQVVPMTDGSFWLRGSGGYDTGIYEHYTFSDAGDSVSKNLMITYENLGKSNEKIQDESGRDFTWEEVQAEINQYEILSSDVMIWNRL